MLSVIEFCMQGQSRGLLLHTGLRTLDLGMMDVDIGEMIAKGGHSYMDRL